MAKSETFEIELPDDLAQFVRAQVDEGADASDVVREALRSMQRQTVRLAELRAMVKASVEDARPPLSAAEVRAKLAQHAQTLTILGEHA
jgi:putative addiction module CopG family antidote